MFFVGFILCCLQYYFYINAGYFNSVVYLAARSDINTLIEELKTCFKSRSIPLEVDFHNLIDIADIGRLATGQSPVQTNVAANTGLILDAERRLAIKSKAAEGAVVDTDGISVKQGNGITVNTNGVSVQLVSRGGITSTQDGLELSNDAWVTMYARSVGATLYGMSSGIYVFATVVDKGWTELNIAATSQYVPYLRRTGENIGSIQGTPVTAVSTITMGPGKTYKTAMVNRNVPVGAVFYFTMEWRSYQTTDSAYDGMPVSVIFRSI